ncbi:hypothetical protein D9756_001956 [Leucocoprinus leucothites]|uniref:Uncharacterized protein n=1 Tax=Leucocoprinus leucothites TaxID=201217 RepID=A0A8H5G477_9AGAR|nr:hypothetical protein D9756_001956 [Leucoagaricus leucothites]
MHSHLGFVTTRGPGFRIGKWSILLLTIYSTSWFLTTSSLSHPYLQLVLVLQQTAAHFTRMAFVAARTAARKAANAISHGGHNGPGQSAVHKLRGGAPVRHASTTTVQPPRGLGPCPPKPPRSPAHKLFSQTRNIWTQIFNQLTAPGLRVPTYLHNTSTGAARSLHSSGTVPTIKSGLSFHARTALSSGPRYHLPRPPHVGVQVATNVGLGTARNFSTARPIFQNLVDNVPVVGRAFYEADLDLKQGRTKHHRARRIRLSSQEKTREMLKPRETPLAVPSSEDSEADIAHYFDTGVAPVTTYLLVPLAPTPTSRVPLPEVPLLYDDSPALLPPLSYFGHHHALHDNHAARVSSLFLRLDQARVWSKGAKCSAYGNAVEDGGGHCTMLTVEFVGWTSAEVRAVIGEGGTGWCGLVERRFGDVDEMSEHSSVADPAEIAAVKSSDHREVSSSFIMPTLDLSSSGVDLSVPSSPSTNSFSLPSSTFSSRPMSPIPDDISEYEDPWRDDGLEANIDNRHYRTPSESGSERSWQRMGAVEFSAQHLEQWH